MSNEHVPVEGKHLQVVPREGESADRLIRRFIKKVRNDGILAEVYEKKFYRKPSEHRRRKSAKAKRQALSDKK